MRRSNPGLKALDELFGCITFALCRTCDSVRRVFAPRYRGALPDPKSVRSVLVIKLCCLGDGLLTIPAVRALKSHYPNARLTVLCTPRSYDAYAGQPFIDEIINANITGMGGVGELLGNLRSLLATLAAVRRTRPDIAVDLDLYFKATPVLAFFSGAPVRVGFDTEGCRRAGLFSYSAPRGRTKHELLCFLDVVGALGVHTDDKSLCFPLGDADLAAGRHILHAAGVPAGIPVIALCPGSSKNWPQKQWPAEHFAYVGDYLAERLEGYVVLIGTFGEQAVHDSVIGAMKCPAASLAGRCTVRETGAVLRASDILVTNDTGPSHLAAALGVPVVTVFGPTDDRKWRPWHEKSRTVRAAICDKAPCYWLSSMPNCPDIRCLTNLSPEAVIAAAMSLLAEDVKAFRFNQHTGITAT